nr:hypothetical protein [Synechococcus sp. AH-603-L18]
MKLLSSIVTATVIGTSIIGASPSYSRDTDWNNAYQHCISTDSELKESAKRFCWCMAWSLKTGTEFSKAGEHCIKQSV